MSALLALNAGSSSLKLALFALDDGGPRETVRGKVDRLNDAPRFTAKAADGHALADKAMGHAGGYDAVLKTLLDWIDRRLGNEALAAVGHRIVHGGRDLVAPVRVTDDTLRAMEALTPLAPLHQPHGLAAIRAVAAHRPDLQQVACFDTAFHRTNADAIHRFAIPRALGDEGIERYGFHGLSYEYIADRLRADAPALAAGRVVVAHLGNGASLCAMADGHGVETTMGFTALDGVPMGTRPGALDPGVVLYLLQTKRWDAARIEDMLYRRSGLLGLSGVSADMRALLESPDPHAAEAVAIFAHRVAQAVAALATTLGGLDALIFTAGIGENVPPVRAAVCERLGWLGVAIDPAANARNAADIAGAGGRVAVRVVPTDEEAMIARHCAALRAS